MAHFQRIWKGVLRRASATWYGLGRGVECPYCGWTGSQFLPAGARRTANRLCPRCGSLERYRMLYLYLRDQSTMSTEPVCLLDIAPKQCFTNYCQRMPNVTYISSDLATPGAMVFTDLTSIGMANESFNIIVCLHVLEHIRDDHACFCEIRRLLRPEGFGLLMVPLCGNATLEDPNARPDDYERLFGQNDHVRCYGQDIVARIEAAGLQVQTIDAWVHFDNQRMQHYGLYGDDRYFFRVRKMQ